MTNTNLYETITTRIIEQLEQGIIPWQRPWSGSRNGAYSRATGRPYSLLNQLMLSPGEYLTFNQCKAAGGSVKKGEKGHHVFFWKPYPITETNSAGETVTKTIPLMKYFTVFRVDQCEGIEPKYSPEALPAAQSDDTAECIAQDYITRSGVHLVHEPSNRAFYSPSRDTVTMPQREQFRQTAEYYGTLFHELAHSTGHATRLNRLDGKNAAFGSEEYSKEELVAEIAAAALVNHAGLETGSSLRNSAAYVQSWIRALKNDKTMIVSASGKAEKAFQMIAHVIGDNVGTEGA